MLASYCVVLVQEVYSDFYRFLQVIVSPSRHENYCSKLKDINHQVHI